MEECLRAKGGLRSGGIDEKRFEIREDCVLANGLKGLSSLTLSSNAY